MKDIVRLINMILGEDHKRNCDGRTYSCTCGYDLHVIEQAERAHAEVTRIRSEVNPQATRGGGGSATGSQD